MPRASLGCIATINGEHGQEINAQSVSWKRN
jgi:hypothetical protein